MERRAKGGGLAGTRTLDQPRKLSGLLYRNRLCNEAKASRGFFLRFISRSKARASSIVASSTAAAISRLSPNRFVECVWPCRCSLSRRSRLVVDPMYVVSPGIAAQNVSPSHLLKSGGLAGTRTLDQCLKRALLYQLSYQPTPMFSRLS